MVFDTIGDRIAHIRGGLTQAEFSKRLGVSRKTLIRYEKNESDPSAPFLQALISDFGADPQWLLMGGDSPMELTPREAVLVDHYRNCDETGRDAMLRTGAALAKPRKDVKKAG